MFHKCHVKKGCFQGSESKLLLLLPGLFLTEELEERGSETSVIFYKSAIITSNAEISGEFREVVRDGEFSDCRYLLGVDLDYF